MDILNYFILIMWFIIITSFLKQMIKPPTTVHMECTITNEKRSIISKYIPLFSILLFITVIKLFPI